MESSQLDTTPDFYKPFLESEEKENTIEKLSFIEKMGAIIPYSLPNEHLLCNDCSEVPRIKIINFNTIDYECKKNKGQMIIADLLKGLGAFESDEDKKDDLLCKEHKEEFAYYCSQCNCNICRDCLRKDGKHIGHTLIILDELYFKLKIQIQHIVDILKINKDKNNEKDDSNPMIFDNINIDAENFIRLISIIINDFNNYQNYFLYQNIENIYKYLVRFIENKKNKNELNKLDYKIQEKIIGLRSLNERFKTGNLSQIVSIEISNVYYYVELSKICEAELFSLETLKMTNCFIKDISPLKRAKFKNIKSINFALNEIDDENGNIQTFSKLPFKDLKELNLF